MLKPSETKRDHIIYVYYIRYSPNLHENANKKKWNHIGLKILPSLP